MDFSFDSCAGSLAISVFISDGHVNRVTSLGGNTFILMGNDCRFDRFGGNFHIGPATVTLLRPCFRVSRCRNRGHIRLRYRAGVSSGSTMAPTNSLVRRTCG